MSADEAEDLRKRMRVAGTIVAGLTAMLAGYVHGEDCYADNEDEPGQPCECGLTEQRAALSDLTRVLTT